MLDERGLGDTGLLVVRGERARGRPAARRRRSRRCAAGSTRWRPTPQARGELVRRTLAGALDSIPPRVGDRAGALAEQVAAAAGAARGRRSTPTRSALDEVDETLRSGALLRGEVLARWHEVVGTGDFMRALEARVGRLRDRLRSLVTGAPAADAELRAAVRDGRRRGGRRRRGPRRRARGRRAGARTRPGAALLAGADAHGRRVAPSSPARTRRAVRAWQGDVFELVRDEGAGKRTTARLASLGVNGAGLTVMIAVFAQHRRADRRGGRGRRRHLGGRPERARGDLRRPGRPPLAARARERLLGARARAARRRGGALRPRCSSRRARTRARPGGSTRAASRERSSAAAVSRRPRPAARRARRGGGARGRAARRRSRSRPRARSSRGPGERLGLGVEATVVALAGPTGAGKSSLFNALAGGELVRRAAGGGRRRPRRPRRSGATAPARCSTGSRSRAGTASAGDGLDGLVLLDLPDFDSVEAAPPRGGRPACSSSPTSSCGSSTRRSTPTRRCTTATCGRWPRTARRCSSSSTRPTCSTPRRCAPAAATSAGCCARTGSTACRCSPPRPRPATGLARCATALAERVAAREAAVARLAADVERAASALAAACGGRRADGVGAGATATQLLAALAEAAGVPAVVRAVERAHRRHGALATGWPLVRWVRRLRPDPLRRLRLPEPRRRAAQRTSLPGATGVQRAEVERRHARRSPHAPPDGLPEPWPALVRRRGHARRGRAARPPRPRGRRHRPARARTPRWWRVARAAAARARARRRGGRAVAPRARGARLPPARRRRADPRPRRLPAPHRAAARRPPGRACCSPR